MAIAPINVWAVGANIEHFNGTTWSIVPSPGEVGLNRIETIAIHPLSAPARARSARGDTPVWWD